MATYFAFFNQNSPLFLPEKRAYLTHLLKYESQFYNRTQVCTKNIIFIFLKKHYVQGVSRHQLQMSSLEDKVTADNPVRFIDAFVNHIDTVKIGFSTQSFKKRLVASKNNIEHLKNYKQNRKKSSNRKITAGIS